MTTTTSSIPFVMDTFVAQVGTRDLLDGVTIASAPLPRDATAGEYVCLLGISDGDVTWANMGAQAKDERYSIDGLIRASEPGSGEEAAKVARDRAFAYLNDVQDAVQGRNSANQLTFVDGPNGVNASIGSSGTKVWNVEVALAQLGQGINEAGHRICDIAFWLRVAARVTRTP